MNYSEYTTEDFILNPHFREWVANPNIISNKYWENWLKKYPEKIHELKEAKKMLRDFPLEYNHLKDEAVESMWHNLERSTQEVSNNLTLDQSSVVNNADNKKSLNESGFWRRAQKSAAAVILLLGTIYGITILSNQNTQLVLDKEVTFLTKENPRGQKSTVYLKDGSKVILNANSKLIYPEQFSINERVVRLEGEAFFVVAKDSDRPFKVVTSNLTTMALGTSFNINTNSDQVHVALLTGKVLVYNNTDMDKTKAILTPGQDVYFNENNNELVKGEFDEHLILGWKNQTIVFKKASEDLVISTLEEWYNVDINTKNQASLNWDYSGEFKNMDLDNVLRSIGFTMDFRYKIEEQKVTIIYK